MSSVPEDVLSAYALQGAQCRPLHGLINRSYVVDASGRRAVVQCLHPVFGAAVHHDIEAVTARLEAQGLCTPRLLRTVNRALWVEHDGEVWRAQSFIEGVTHHRLTAPEQAHAAGTAVARFHRALDGFAYEFRFARSNVHDTASHLEALRAVLRTEHSTQYEQARQCAERIVGASESLDLASLDPLPRRVCHGDLKISNLLFEPAGAPRVRCLIDLDTLGLQSIAYELGDALRSWCNPHTEDVAQPELDITLFDAALAGYAEQAPGLLSAAEVDSIVSGLHTVCLELASRFCHDAFADSYFGWDESRYPSRRAHNLARARSMLALGLSVERDLDLLREHARAAFG